MNYKDGDGVKKLLEKGEIAALHKKVDRLTRLVEDWMATGILPIPTREYEETR